MIYHVATEPTSPTHCSGISIFLKIVFAVVGMRLKKRDELSFVTCTD